MNFWTYAQNYRPREIYKEREGENPYHCKYCKQPISWTQKGSKWVAYDFGRPKKERHTCGQRELLYRTCDESGAPSHGAPTGLYQEKPNPRSEERRVILRKAKSLGPQTRGSRTIADDGKVGAATITPTIAVSSVNNPKQ